MHKMTVFFQSYKELTKEGRRFYSHPFKAHEKPHQK